MSVKKTDREYIDAKGNLHKVFASGRTEIYINGPHSEGQFFIEITDAADESVNRQRFMPSIRENIEDTIQVREDDEGNSSQEATPGLDSLDADKEVAEDGNTT